MCFHTAITSKSQQLELRFGAKFYNTKIKSDFNEKKYHLNGFSHPNLPVITQEVPESILPAVWGIVPTFENPDELTSYFKKASKFGAGLNARSEKLSSHFLYKKLYKSNRCLILIDAFYEPHKYQNKSYPYIIKRKDNQPFALAGLYTRFENGLLTCTILTKDAMPYLAKIHNIKKRQPVILTQANEKKWLNAQLSEVEITSIINQNLDEQSLSSYTVSRKLFNPQKESNLPSITEQVVYPELTPLF